LKISMLVRCASAVVVSFAPLACQSYAPLVGEPAPGQSVRARLTPPGAVRQAEISGVARTSVDGKFVETRGDGLALEVPILGLVPELQRSPKVADTIVLQVGEIAEIETPRFSALRTAGFIASLGAVVALALAISGDAGGNQDTPPTPPVSFGPELQILRLPIGR
jgi:hypothetical protein